MLNARGAAAPAVMIKHAVSIHWHWDLCYGWFLSVLVSIIINHRNTMSHTNAIQHCLCRKHTIFNYEWKIRSERTDGLTNIMCDWLTVDGGASPLELSHPPSPSASAETFQPSAGFLLPNICKQKSKPSTDNSLLNKTLFKESFRSGVIFTHWMIKLVKKSQQTLMAGVKQP